MIMHQIRTARNYRVMLQSETSCARASARSQHTFSRACAEAADERQHTPRTLPHVAHQDLLARSFGAGWRRALAMHAQPAPSPARARAEGTPLLVRTELLQSRACVHIDALQTSSERVVAGGGGGTKRVWKCLPEMCNFRSPNHRPLDDGAPSSGGDSTAAAPIQTYRRLDV